MTYRHVAGRVRAMTEKGLSPKTIANVHGAADPSLQSRRPSALNMDGASADDRVW